MRIVKKPGFISIAISVVLLVVFFIVSSAGHGEANNKPPSNVNLAGAWKQSKSGIPDVVMTAEITEGGIQITMDVNGMHGTFWLGTFDAHPVTSKILSKGDPDALGILGSSEKNKTFEYKNGQISFEFSIMKTETTVYLERK